ncbi:MAG: SGNH/GDSL hydrolase family protein [bacterium]
MVKKDFIKLWVFKILLYFAFLCTNVLYSKSFDSPFAIQNIFKPIPIPPKTINYQLTTTPGYEYTDPHRLLKIIAIGDSLLQNFYNCDLPCKLKQFLTLERKHAFIDIDPEIQSIESVFEKFSKITPTLAMNVGAPGSMVINPPKPSLLYETLGIRSLREQVEIINSLAIPPDLTFVWLGHNDVNLYTKGFSEKKLLHEFETEFKKQIQKLVFSLSAQESKRKKSIIVFSLGSFESAFKARDECEARKKLDSSLFDSFENVSKDFKLVLKENREDAYRLNKETNQIMENTIRELNSYCELTPNIEIRFSYKPQDINQLSCDDLSPHDAFHPGKNEAQLIANLFYEEALKSLDFVMH